MLLNLQMDTVDDSLCHMLLIEATRSSDDNLWAAVRILKHHHRCQRNTIRRFETNVTTVTLYYCGVGSRDSPREIQ